MLVVQRLVCMSCSNDNIILNSLGLVNGMTCKNNEELVIKWVPQAMIYKVF